MYSSVNPTVIKIQAFMKFHILLLLCLAGSTITAFTQNKSPEVDQLVIQLKPEVAAESFLNEFISKQKLKAVFYAGTPSPNRQLSLLEFDPYFTDAQKLMDLLNKKPEVNFAAFNEQATIRATPNDPDYTEQWHMTLINAPEVWNFTTGGLTPLGDTIVIASLESCDTQHEDLRDNIWRNYLEIPNNGIDDDNNGYTDDYEGYNTVNDNDQHLISSHGSRVCGLMGAKGDNAIGVTGVNWDTKMMVVSNTLLISDIITSCEYVLNQRVAYNESDGAEGAFIVATNSSFGFDRKFPEDNPLFGIWCDLMEEMGQAGILSVVACNNDNIDVDQVGDLPSFCSSDYIIVVTNTDRQDELKGSFSGTATHMDLSAPGTESFSTRPNNEYGTIGGSSASSPHVTGGIGLLYSAPCVDFASFTQNNPTDAALLMKDLILDGTTKLLELEGKTVSGGRLNLEGSLNLLQEFCGGAAGPLAITSIIPNPSFPGEQVFIRFQTPDETTYRFKVTDVLGRTILNGEKESTTFGNNLVEIETSNFAHGIYYFTVENSRDTKTEAFVVF